MKSKSSWPQCYFAANQLLITCVSMVMRKARDDLSLYKGVVSGEPCFLLHV